MGDVGIAVGYEKMRDAQGKMDGKLVGKVLGYFSHPDEREGKVFVFPHIFAEVMELYMKEHGVSARELGAIAVTDTTTRATTRTRRCATSSARWTNREDRRDQPLHRRGAAAQDVRLLANHRRYAALIVATEEGLARLGLEPNRLRASRWMGAGGRSAAGGGPRRASSAGRVLRDARALTRWRA